MGGGSVSNHQASSAELTLFSVVEKTGRRRDMGKVEEVVGSIQEKPRGTAGAGAGAYLADRRRGRD